MAVLALAATLAGCGVDKPAAGTGAPAAVAGVVDCADGSISAQGSSAQANAVNIWIKNYQAACPKAAIEYASIGSGAGLRAFIDGTGDFAGSDAALSAADQPRADARCAAGPAIHLPMVVGPIALAYNVAGVPELRLRPATIAKIFSTAVSTWDDPAIAADNPGVALPSTKIRVLHRSESSGTTDSFTKFLASTASGDWSFGSGTNWPAPGGGAEQGNTGVAAAIARSDGAIGYVEWSYAQALELRSARVANGAGEFVELSTEAAGLAVAEAEIAGTGNDLKLGIAYGGKTAGAYPIVLVTYEVVCQKGTPATSLPLVKSFLNYTSGAASQAAVTRLGYAPLPERIRARVASAVAALA